MEHKNKSELTDEQKKQVVVCYFEGTLVNIYQFNSIFVYLKAQAKDKEICLVCL